MNKNKRMFPFSGGDSLKIKYKKKVFFYYP
jgi:hypothetical protein